LIEENKVKKHQLLKFLEPFDDNIEIEIKTWGDNDEVDFEPEYDFSGDKAKIFLVEV
jgi:hypothetical protein